MADFTVYNRKTGAIVRAGFCAAEDLDAQAGPGEAVYEGVALSDATHSFVKGKPVETPSPMSGVDFSLAVNGERTRRRLTGTVINGVHVTGDDATQAVLKGLAFRAERRQREGSDERIIYRDAANVTHTLTPDEFMAVYDQADAYFEAVAVHSWQIKGSKKAPADVAADELWPERTLPES